MIKRSILTSIIVAVGLVVALGLATGGSHAVQAQGTVGGSDKAAVGSSLFTYHPITTTYPYCSAISVADVDQDGDVDILSSRQGATPAIHLWLNDGTGSFTGGGTVGALGATVLSAYDMDDDSDVDVAAILPTTYSLPNFPPGTFENLGDGNWTKKEFPSGLFPLTALSPIGWMSQGKNYLLMATAKERRIHAYDNLTTFRRLVDTSSGWISSIYPYDMDRDDTMDILATYYWGGDAILWYECDYSSIRKDIVCGEDASKAHIIQAKWSRPEWAQAGDVDRDGDPDVVAASETQGLFWWENTDRKGQSWAMHRISYEFFAAASLHLVDMDNDGDLDVLGATTRQLVWLENLGTSTTLANWVRHVVEINPYQLGQGYALVQADVNGDGQMDIVSCDLNRQDKVQNPNRRLGWWENEHTVPTASEISWRVMDIDTTLVGAWGVDVGDFDGDGRLDVAAAGYGNTATSGETRWWRNTPGVIVQWTEAFTATFDEGRGVTTERSNYLVSGNANTGEVREFYSAGSDWTTPGQYMFLSGLDDTYTAAVADINDDGIRDIIGASTTKDEIVWAKSIISSDSWVQQTIDDNGDGARDVCAGDFDSDGDLDVAAACQNENRIHWWQNSNDGGIWTAKTVAVNFPGATAVECGDINGDGVDEMIAANTDVAWFKPDATVGNGATMGWITNVFTGTEFIALHDLDRDGDLDVLATSPTLDELAWLENTGTGSYTDDFPVHGLDESLGGVREVAVGDLSGDGAPDIVVAAQNAGLVRWYEQIVDTQLSLEKSLDFTQADVISTGQSITYRLQVTNNSLNGADADVLVVDRWEPPDAIVNGSSDEDCIGDFDHGVMTCTLTAKAGHIQPMQIVLTPSLLFDGVITNTAQVLPVAPYWNSTSYLDTNAAAPVEVQQNMAIWDGQINVGNVPSTSLLPGQAFTYTVGVVNSGPKAGGNATVTSLWAPISAIDGYTYVGATASTARLAAADYDCIVGDVEDGVICDFNDLAVGVPITVTIGVTTTEAFTQLLKADIYLMPDGDEGYAANNQNAVPVRVGSRPWERVYLPLVLRQ